MAAKSNKRSDELLLFPPLKDFCRDSVSQSPRKAFGNFGTCVLLPALDPVQNVNVFYGVKRICKCVCEWYLTWRPWQKEVLLCSLSGKCSVSQLLSLSTILEPVFHRDFVSRLHGRYPVKDLRQKPEDDAKRRPKVEQGSRTKRGRESREKSGKINFVQEEINSNSEHSDLCQINDLCQTLEDVITDSSVAVSSSIEVQDVFKNQPMSLCELIKQNITKRSDEKQCQSVASQRVEEDKVLEQPFTVDMPCKLSDNLEQKSPHKHTPCKKDSSRKFFSASQLKSLKNMKADLQSGRRFKVERRLSDLDAKCYKHAKWWTNGTNNKRLVSAHNSKLWNHFSRQLREINEIMDSWGDHERVNLLSEVIKSSEPEQISFFAQCLIQRLKDRTDVSTLPDRTILKIFAKLDAKTLCHVSQVSRRWRYLGEDTHLWRIKCIQLGWSKGIKNLVLLIEKSANNHCVDWKHAYQEVCEIFQEREVVKEDIQQGSPNTVNVYEDDWRDRQRREHLASKILKERNDPNSERQRITPKYETSESASPVPDKLQRFRNERSEITSNKVLSAKADVAIVTKVDIEAEGLRDEDITGGNLQLLEESLFELTDGSQSGATRDELARDIRPLKIQAKNEMDKNGPEVYQQVTVAVEDVKSVKRVRNIQGHMDGVFCVQFDSKRCLTGSADRVLRMWDVRSGKGIRKMFGHSGGIRCIQFDNTKIMSGSWDSTIMVWDIVKFTCIGVLYGHEGCVSCLRFNSKFIISGSHDKTVRVWDVDTWECLRVLKGHKGEVTCLFVGGQVLLTGSTDRSIKKWNIRTGECLETLVGHESSVLALKASWALIISGSEDGKILFWNIESKQCVAAIEGHDGPCYCLFIWGSHFLSGGGDHIIKEWDISTLTCLRTLQGHQGPVYSIKMSSKRIVSSSEDGTVRIWDLEVPVQQIGGNMDEDDKTLLPFDFYDCEQSDGSIENGKSAEEEFWVTWKSSDNTPVK